MRYTAHANTFANEDVCIVLDILANLANSGVFQQRPECVQHQGLVELFRRAFVSMTKRYVTGRTRFQAKRNTHQFRSHVIDTGGFGIDGKTIGLAQAL